VTRAALSVRAARDARKHASKQQGRATVYLVERSLETQVSQAVDAWLRWLPR